MSPNDIMQKLQQLKASIEKMENNPPQNGGDATRTAKALKSECDRVEAVVNNYKPELTVTAPGGLDVNVKASRYPPRRLFEKVVARLTALRPDRYERFIDHVFFDVPFTDKPSTKVPDSPDASTLDGRIGNLDPYDALVKATEYFLRVEMGTAREPRDDASRPPDDYGVSKGLSDWVNDHSKKVPEFLDSVLKDVPDEFRITLRGATLAMDGAEFDDFNRDPTKSLRDENWGIRGPNEPRRLLCETINPCCWELSGGWLEEAAVLARFQGLRVQGDRGDALAQLNVEPSSLLNAWLKGRVAAYQQRQLTSLDERTIQYEGELGIRVRPAGAGPEAAEVATGLVPALLDVARRLILFYREQANKMVEADPTPILHALRALQVEADAVDANRAGEMAYRLRKEMLVARAILAEPTLYRTFVSRPTMRRTCRYQLVHEAVKHMLGWSLADIAHYDDLAFTSELVVASAQAQIWVSEDRADVAGGLGMLVRDQVKLLAQALRMVGDVDLTVHETVPVDLTIPAHVTQLPNLTIMGRGGGAAPDVTNRPRPAAAAGRALVGGSQNGARAMRPR